MFVYYLAISDSADKGLFEMVVWKLDKDDMEIEGEVTKVQVGRDSETHNFLIVTFFLNPYLSYTRTGECVNKHA